MILLITAPYNEQARIELEKISQQIIYRPWKPQGRAYNEQELIALLEESGADALITEHDQVTEKVINRFPRLQFIGVCRGTPSNLHLAAATVRGIPVFFTPARNAQAVAEMFIANVITFMRNTLPGIAWLKEGNWDAGAHTSYLQFKGNELAGKTIGMLGFGAIGQLIARLAEPFPCNIRYYDPYVNATSFAHRSGSLEEVFSESDIVSVHLPVNDETKGMIDSRLLQLMKPGAIFVNTARAVVVNRTDLLKTLNEGKIAGAILDVFENEPPDELDYQIIRHPRVLATPHIAGATYEVEDHHARIMNETLYEWFVLHKRTTERLANKNLLTIKI